MPLPPRRSRSERVQQAMRDAGVRGVVSVLDGWPVP